MNLELVGCKACQPGNLSSPERLTLLRDSGLLVGKDDFLEKQVLLVKDLLDIPVVLCSLVDYNRQVFASHLGLPEPWCSRPETPLSHSFCQYVVTDGRPLIVSDARDSVRLQTNLAIRDLGVIAYAGFPIVSKGQILGSFCAIDGKPREWTILELRVLARFAETISDQIDLRLDLKELEQTKESVVLANRDLEDFASILSHDLKAPLRGITGCLQLLLGELPSLNEDLDELSSHIFSSTARMRELIQGLSYYSESMATPSPKDDLDLDVLFAEVTDDLTADLEKAGAELVLESSLGAAKGHASLLRQVFQNLIANALKFQPEGQRPVIRVGRQPDGVFYVQDNGIGLEDNFQSRAFSLYKRSESAQKYEGMGIGLAVCARVISRHHGRIWVESEFGQGAKFLFTLNLC